MFDMPTQKYIPVSSWMHSTPISTSWCRMVRMVVVSHCVSAVALSPAPLSRAVQAYVHVGENGIESFKVEWVMSKGRWVSAVGPLKHLWLKSTSAKIVVDHLIVFPYKESFWSYSDSGQNGSHAPLVPSIHWFYYSVVTLISSRDQEMRYSGVAKYWTNM